MKASARARICGGVGRISGAACVLLLACAILLPAIGRAQSEKAKPKASASTAGSSSSSADSSKKASDEGGSAGNGNAANGKKVFMADGCFECHGTVGQGSTQTGGARIGPPSISLDAVIQYARHPAGQMPPYTSKVISDQELTDIYAYLKSQPQPPRGKSIPLLNQ